MSVLCQEETRADAATCGSKATLLDHLIGAGEQYWVGYSARTPSRHACARKVELAAPAKVVLSNGFEMDFMLIVIAAVVRLGRTG